MRYSGTMDNFTVLAIMPVYNEIDILPLTLKHLAEQGILVYILDNWSTDGSYEEALKTEYDNVIAVERWPVTGPTKYFEWSKMLKRIEDIADEANCNWVMLHDADEIRWSHHEDFTLHDAIKVVDEEGYNCINFLTRHYELQEGWDGKDLTFFRKYREDKIVQTKLWKNIAKVNLHTEGGHNIFFPKEIEKKLFPSNFMLEHYPLRTVEQAKRKILVERLPRYSPIERALCWHVHYDKYAKLYSNELRKTK